MSDELKHECGIAMIRLLKPLEYYQKNPSILANLRGSLYEEKILKGIKQKAANVPQGFQAH